MLKKYNIYTDGSCPNNGSSNAVGGWAFIVLHDNMIDPLCVMTGPEKPSTNQRMELMAAAEAGRYILDYIARARNGEDYEIHLYSDSAYLINCYLQKWWENWEKNGWRNAKKEPVANVDLWVRLIPLFKDNRFIFHKVNGHSGNEYNEAMDKLCRQTAANYEE